MAHRSEEGGQVVRGILQAVEHVMARWHADNAAKSRKALRIPHGWRFREREGGGSRRQTDSEECRKETEDRVERFRVD